MSDSNIIDQTISSDDTFTEPLTITDGQFVIAVTGTFVATVTLQVRPKFRDVAHGWVDEAKYETPDAQISRELVGIWEVRAGIAGGDYVSGSVRITIGNREGFNV